LKFLTDHVERIVRDARAYAGAALGWKGDAIWLQGTAKAGGAPLSVFFFGEVDEVYEYLVDYIFSRYTVQRHEERMSARQGLRLLGDGAGSDVVIGHLGWPYYRAVPHARFLHMPPTLVHKIPLEGSWEQMEQRLRKRKTTKDHLARLRKNDLTFRVTHDRAAIEMFYDTMYLPHVVSRHEDLVQLEPREYLLAVAEEGGLLQVMQGDRWLAGSVLYRVDNSMQGLWLGLVSGLDSNMVRAGLVGIYYLVMRHAIEQGCEELNLMYSPPLLNNGIFRFKCKLGSRVSNEWQFSRVVLRATNLGPAVAQLFTRMPMAVVDPGNRLVGRVLLDRELQSPGELVEICRELSCDGIERLDVYSCRTLSEAMRAADYSEVGPLTLHDLSTSPDPALQFSRS